MNKCTNYQFCDAAINRFGALKPSGITTALQRLLDLECKNSSSLPLTPQEELQAVPLAPLQKGPCIYPVEACTQPEDRLFLFCPFISLLFFNWKEKELFFALLLNPVPTGQISLMYGPGQSVWGPSLLSVMMLMGCHRWLKLTYSRCFVYSANKTAAWN